MLREAGKTAVFDLSQHSTEYVADFYAGLLKTEDRVGNKLKRCQVGSKTAKIILPSRKGDTGMDVLSQYFHLPITQAGRIIGICPTSLKKICRKYGLPRWPYRKVKSMENRLTRAKVRV